MANAAKVIPGNSKNQYIKLLMKWLCLKMMKKLMNYIVNKKKIFFSSPFSRKAVDRREVGVPLYKLVQVCNNYPFVEYICKKKKPIILSTE